MARNLPSFDRTGSGKSSKKSVHFIGIGGIGTSALARWFLAKKWVVFGSDLAESAITKELRKEGVKVKIGHKKGHIPSQTSLSIYSQAVKRDNPEFREAIRRKTPLLSYPEAVGRLTDFYKTVAVAGAHGKSTTTALAALVLIKAGLDPTVIVGTKLKEFGGKNFRAGKGRNLILEADEYGKAFLHYSPFIAVVTNIDREHLDIYKNLAGVKNAFLKFFGRVKNGGILILNQDDKNILSLAKRIKKLSAQKKLKIIWYSIHGHSAQKIKQIIKISGAHNLSDAIAAYKIGRMFGVTHKKILSAISSYRGSWRRMEFRGQLKIVNYKLRIFDDYAHHPAEIKATLLAFREKYPKSQIICVFQPHQTKRLKALFNEFQTAFNDADKILILPIYKVAGRDENAGRYDSEALVRAMQKRFPLKPVFYLKDPRNLKRALAVFLRPEARDKNKNSEPKTIVVMMGAGDIANYTDCLLKLKRKRSEFNSL